MSDPLRGEIYIVDFGVPRGSEPAGRHHAVVVQNDVGNAHSPTTTVAYVTSSLPTKKYPMHVWLDAGTTGKECVVKCELLLTIQQDRLQALVGALSPGELQQLNQALRHQLNLA